MIQGVPETRLLWRHSELATGPALDAARLMVDSALAPPSTHLLGLYYIDLWSECPARTDATATAASASAWHPLFSGTSRSGERTSPPGVWHRGLRGSSHELSCSDSIPGDSRGVSATNRKLQLNRMSMDSYNGNVVFQQLFSTIIFLKVRSC